jgi:hypothetical protein
MLRKFKCPYCGMPFEIQCIFEMIIINLKIYFFCFSMLVFIATVCLLCYITFITIYLSIVKINIIF